MNKKIALMFSAFLVMTMALSGCQLAREDGLAVESDRMVGMYITNEYLDLFDMDSWFENNSSKILNGGDISVTDSAQYHGRIYAELVEKPYTSDDTGETHSTWDYVFSGLDGVPFFYAEVAEPDGTSFLDSFTGGLISKAHFTTGNQTILEGTLFLALDSPTTVYMNPVYQSSDGSVYLTAGEGYSSSGHDAEGAIFSTTLEQTHTTKENGEEVSEYFKITLHISSKNRPEIIRIIQMSSQNVMVSGDEYHPDSLPEQIEANPQTAYIILETEGRTQNGSISFSRELTTDTEYYITAYAARPDGIIEPRSIELLWE